MSKIYELVDSTDDERYWTLGVWNKLEDALESVKTCEEPSDFDSGGDCEDYFKIEIRERSLGWSGVGKKVFERSWVQKYDEEKDDYYWEKR